MKDIKAIRGKYYIGGLIAEGEHECQDFKYSISDARKIARSLSAFANHRGGRLLIGVKDNGCVAGVRNEEDIYVVEQAAKMYCRPEQNLEFSAYTVEDGAVVIKVEIQPSPVRPVQAMDTDGKWKSYFRVADENILATPLMVKSWRRKASPEHLSFSLGEVEEHLLNMLRDEPELTVESFMTEVRVSRRVAEDIVTRMFALGLIEFRFVGRRFVIALSETE